MGVGNILSKILGKGIINNTFKNDALLGKIKIINTDTLMNISSFSKDYPHILIASRESSIDRKTHQVFIKEYTNVNEFLNELTIMEKIANLAINVPIPRLYGACDCSVLLKKNQMPSFKLVMEKINAPDLLTLILDNGLNYTNRLKVCIQLVSLIKKLHSQNIVHRDIKCENLLVSTGKKLKLTIIDFACSIIINNDDEYNESFVGTMNYFSPELYYKQYYLPKQNDIWSVGVVIYILLSGGFYPYLYSSKLTKRKFYKQIARNIHYELIDDRVAKVLKSIFVPERKRISAWSLNNSLLPILTDIILEHESSITSHHLMTPRRSLLVSTL